ncbi:hypothetical protein D3C83_131600 [compost metagenome]
MRPSLSIISTRICCGVRVERRRTNADWASSPERLKPSGTEISPFSTVSMALRISAGPTDLGR